MQSSRHSTSLLIFPLGVILNCKMSLMGRAGLAGGEGARDVGAGRRDASAWEAFAQQERTSYPVYSLKLKQKLLQEAAAARRTKVRPSPWTQAEPLPGAQGLMAFYVFCCIYSSPYYSYVLNSLNLPRY